MTNDFRLDFDIVVIETIKEAWLLSRFFRKTFNVKYQFHRGYYEISFDKQEIMKTTHFWNKNTYWREKHIKTYTVRKYVEIV